MNFFKPHSTRAAATSGAFLKSMPLEHILAFAGWSSSATFAKFYKKPVINIDSVTTSKTPNWFAINMFFGVCYFFSCVQCALKSHLSPQCGDGI